MTAAAEQLNTHVWDAASWTYLLDPCLESSTQQGISG